MIAVTERAKEHLLDMKRSARINEPEVGLRLKPAATGEWQLFPDQALEGDQIVEHGGSKLLLIGPDASDALGDRQVDCQEAAPGQVTLVLTRSKEPTPDTRRKPSICARPASQIAPRHVVLIGEHRLGAARGADSVRGARQQSRRRPMGATSLPQSL